MQELDLILPGFDHKEQHFRCTAHILNLAVQDLLKNLLKEEAMEDRILEYSDDDSENEELPEIEDSSTALSKFLAK